MIHQTLSWNRTRERLPTADRGRSVLAHSTRLDETQIATVDFMRTEGHDFDWWAELPRPNFGLEGARMFAREIMKDIER